MRRLELIGVLAVLVAGALLRLPGLGARALWLDEAFTLEAARAGDLLGTLREHIGAPLYPLLARAALALEPWLGLEAALRLPSALAGCLSPLVVFTLARRRAGPRAALLAAAALALHPGQVLAAQEARTYALEVLLAALLLLQADRLAARWRAVDGALLGALAAALVACHVLGGALALACGAALLPAARARGPEAWRALGLAALVGAALVLPLAPLLLGIGERMLGDAGTRVEVGLRTVEGVVRELAGVTAAPSSRLAVATLPPLALLGAVVAARRGRRDEPLVPALALLAVLLALAVKPPAALYTRYFAFLLPSALLLAGRGTSALGRRGGALAAAALLLSLSHALVEARAVPDVPYGRLAAWLEERVRPGDRVLLHVHRSPRPGAAGERRALGVYASPRVRAALTDAQALPLDAPPARTFAVVVLRPRHALASAPEGATLLAPRVVVLPPTGADLTARDAVRRLAELDRRLPQHDEARWRAAFGRWVE